MSKIYDAIMGLVVGDALGVPVEFKKRNTYEITDMTGYGTYNQPPGTWSDDSSMTLATVESIARTGTIDLYDIMSNFIKWWRSAEFTPWGETFDIGVTTSRALNRFQCGVEPLNCGLKELSNNGNGSLMRILPVALFESGDFHKMLKSIRKVGMLTHATHTAYYGCAIYGAVVRRLMNGKPVIHNIANTAYMDIAAIHKDGKEFEAYDRISMIGGMSREEIRSSGYVVDSLEAALWCLINTDNYKDCVLAAVNLGEDTDTIAAIAGGLAGMLYGVGGKKGIPEKWIKQIARKDWIFGLCKDFESKLSKIDVT